MPSDKWRVIASGSIEYPVQQTGSQLWLLSARSGLCPLFRQTLEPGVRHSVRQASAASHVLWAAVAELQDRKSVVSGKSVSVRVDLGGRRIIKTQKTRILSLEYYTREY